MRIKLLFALSLIGVVAGCAAAWMFAQRQPPLPPVFAPVANPYPAAIYAEGIVESDQPSGENLNLYPEVGGTVRSILVGEGARVQRGQPLLELDDSIQRATVAQQQAAADAAQALLEELRAQPRPEALAVAQAQVAAAAAARRTAADSWQKDDAAYRADARAVSRDALDSAANAVASADANLAVAQKQLDLTRAGAWEFDIRNQERQVEALRRSLEASRALLAKYTLRAPADGIVLAVGTAPGAYASPQGGYDSYTQAMDPVLVLGSLPGQLQVRCYIDEILLSRLPAPAQMKAQMSVRGADLKLPLRFVRIQPLVSPKIELSDQRQERVDVRVLPVIFALTPPRGVRLYPGELVDVYIGQ